MRRGGGALFPLEDDEEAEGAGMELDTAAIFRSLLSKIKERNR